MRRALIAAFSLPALIIATVATAATVRAQDHQHAAATPQVPREEIAAYAKVEIAIGKARDAIQAELAQARNKTPDAQKQLQEKLRLQIQEILKQNAMTEAEYQRRTYLVSTDPERRKVYEELLGELTGAPTIAQQQAAAAARAGGAGGGGRGGAGGRGGGEPVAVPAGPVGTHLGHVVNAFGDTPNGGGLLPTALAEARVAAQHAALAARNPGSLDAMKLHAGHVIHALDPSVVPMGPGAGYGVKKAATAVASHVELAARAEGASQNVTTHATHIATSARNTAQRVDQIVALAKQVQSSTDAMAAAALLSQISSLSEQLVAGSDANGDGRIGWQEGEGGLQHVEEHVNLLLRGES